MGKKKKTTKAIVALCEGKTDVAFLRRLLKADGYDDYKNTINRMPMPLGGEESYFLKKISEFKYDSAELRDRPILPLILKKVKGQSATYLLLYDMNGMGKIPSYKSIIEDFIDLPIGDYDDDPPLMAISLGFIYDLDDKTVKDRLEYIKSTYGDLVDELKHLGEKNLITNATNFKAVGCLFLGKSGAVGGSLEDVILPMMKVGKELLFKEANKMLNSDGGFVRYKKSNKSQKDNNKTASDLNKALIGAVGQIEWSGLGNADIIKKTSLLNDDQLKNDEQCKNVINFFTELRKKL